MSTDCIFCKIYSERKVVVVETGQFFAQFDRYPVSPGHMEVIPKRHVVDFFDMNPEEQADIISALREGVQTIGTTDLKGLYESFIRDPLNAKSAKFCRRALLRLEARPERDGENIGVNNGRSAGRTVDHVHVHIIPRYKGDVDDPTGGVRHIIPGLGNYRK